MNTLGLTTCRKPAKIFSKLPLFTGGAAYPSFLYIFTSEFPFLSLLQDTGVEAPSPSVFTL